jgi:hypothetical protein
VSSRDIVDGCPGTSEATIELLRGDAGMSRVRDADAAVAAGDLTSITDATPTGPDRVARQP